MRSRWFSCVVAGLVLGVAPYVAEAKTSDAWITTKAKIALLSTEGVSSNSINVDTTDGVVTLHGKVRTAEEKTKAEQEVRKIEGVREVRNLLQVVPASQEKVVKASDDEIKQKAERALKDDPNLKDSSIKVSSVNNGVVVLSGKANSVSEHLEALERVRPIPGVRRVASEIESPDRLADAEIRRGERKQSAEAGVKRTIGGAATDAWITTDVKMRLLADPKTPGTSINVDTNNGNVTLFGIVPSEEAKRAAEADARKVSGVKQVKNELQVVPSAKQEQVKAKDGELEAKVKRAISEREDLKDANISVEVKNGVARLTGTVPSDQDRLAAAIAARSIPGVRAVQDDLQVKSSS